MHIVLKRLLDLFSDGLIPLGFTLYLVLALFGKQTVCLTVTESVGMTGSMYSLLVLALIFANAPFLTQRLFGVAKLANKHFGHHLLELFAGFGIMALLAYLLESRAGAVHSQDWEFYVTVACLYLIFAFPAFVWRYFWHSKHQQ
ncbi:putative inner membrane protein [Neisseria weaveri]|uniref:Putative inner membrane protein n=2 Tax=Neisseria weaveri TaxID=28091 RepID=A0A3S4ZLU4_9NEIS|nr:hypothetical protein l11_21230 [Neisseria weaveri LMG 5135]SAY51941.1 putative inner membrane protein [Neisseria weaveri]VEJ51357.1 putative inner membrane protein [Neisseria weaveri]